MPSIAFWKTWPAVYQRLFTGAAGILAVALLFLWDSNVHSPSPVFEPQHFQQLETLETPVHAFQKGITAFSISTDSYIVLEHVFGGPIQPNSKASYFFLFLLAAGIVFILAILTTLKRFWFFAGMGLFILLFVSLRLDAIALFGFTNKFPVVAILVIYIAIAYYFQFLRPATPFFKRWAVLGLLTAAVGTGIALFGRMPQPFIYLAANGLVAGVVLTVVFTFMVAHEIVAAFVFVVSRTATQQKSLRHFLVITAIYLINLGLIYADKKHMLHWDFFPFPLFLLVAVSGILGVWGFRQREPLYESMIKADPFGIYFYMALATIGFATMGFFLASANDPGIQLLQDSILYSHLGYGLIFFLYIIVNFISLLGNNMRVFKVLYKPSVMPYFTFRFAGLIATFAFFAYSNWKVSFNQAYAGYYNALGDFHLLQDSARAAENDYLRSVFFATRNYHAHYALGQLFGSRNQPGKEKEEYQKVVDGRPLDLAVLNLSQLYVNENALPEALGTLKNGLVDFPNNGLLQNALSLVENRLGRGDSALLLANTARNSTLSRGEAETNVIAFSAKFRLHFPADSILPLMNSDYSGVIANVLALANVQGKTIPMNVDPGTDTVLTVYTATELNNHLINRLTPFDTALVAKTVALARRPSNSYFKNFLLSAAAHACYRSGQTARAFKLMHELAFLGQQSKYYTVLGLWALEQGASENALLFFDEAVRLNGPEAYFDRAVALTETGDVGRAVTAWDSLGRSTDPEIRQHALKMLRVLTTTAPHTNALSNEEKYEFSRHSFTADQGNDFEQFIGLITDQGVRARAIVDRSKRLDETDDIPLAVAVFGMVKGLPLPDKSLYEEILHLNLRFLARQEQWSMLEEQLHKGIRFDGMYQQDSIYFTALRKEKEGKKEEAAKAYRVLASADPFFEDAVVAAVRFLNKNGENKVKTYGILMSALDHNPNSPKLLKAYILQAAAVGFEESAQDGLDKLKSVLHPRAFLQFIGENRGIFEISTN